jgi:hypothetical protein
MNLVAVVKVPVRKRFNTALRQGSAVLYVLFIFAVLVCVTGALVGGTLGLVLTSVATLVVTYVVLRFGNMILPNSICLNTVVCVYGFQTLAQLLIALARATVCPQGGWGMDLADHPGTLALGQSSLLAGTLLAIVVMSPFVKRQRVQSVNLHLRPSAQTRFVIVVALLLHIAAPLAMFVIAGYWGWLIILLTEDLIASAFFVGWFASDLSPVVNGGVFLALIANCLLGGLRGTRYPIALLGLYLAGRLFSSRERHRRRLIIITLAAGIPILLFFSIIGDLRAKRGHEQVELIAPSRWGELAEGISVTNSNYKARGTDPIAQVIQRLYAWPNAASMILSPDPIPYRGFGQWAFGCLPYLQIGTWSEENKQRFFESGVGTVQAVKYGFEVTRTTSVEFGVPADGWSTAGPAGVLVFGFLVMLALCISERIVLFKLYMSYTSRIIFTCILIKGCIQCYIYPAPLVIRYVILYTCMWIVILKLGDILSGYKTRRQRHQLGYQRARVGCSTVVR